MLGGLPRGIAAVGLSVVLLAAAVPVGGARAPTTLTPHIPIDIDGDESFLLPPAINGVVGGSGTAEDPFVVGGWEIVPVLGHGIRISNTTAHVVITLNHVRNGAILPCVTTDNTFKHCLPRPCLDDPGAVCPEQVGIEIRNASNVSISHNRLVANTIGVLVEDSVQVSAVRNHMNRPRDADPLSTALHAAEDGFAGIEDLEESAVQVVRFPYEEFAGIVAKRTFGLTVVENDIVGSSAVTSIGIAVEDAEAVMYGNTLANHTYAVNALRSVLASHANDMQQSWAIRIDANSDATFEGETFRDVRYAIVCGQGTAFRVNSSTFVNSTIMASIKNPACPSSNLRIDVSNNSFSGTAGASTESWGTIRGNRFLNATFPVGVEGDRASLTVGQEMDVADNRFEGGDIGVLVRNATPRIVGNFISANQIGLAAVGPLKPDIQLNCIVSNTEYSLWNTDVGTFSRSSPPGLIPVQAADNWWGGSAGPPSEGPNSIYGQASYEPWLLETPCRASDLLAAKVHRA